MDKKSQLKELLKNTINQLEYVYSNYYKVDLKSIHCDQGFCKLILLNELGEELLSIVNILYTESLKDPILHNLVGNPKSKGYYWPSMRHGKEYIDVRIIFLEYLLNNFEHYYNKTLKV